MTAVIGSRKRTREEFGATCEVAMAAGDAFVIETPGGGGFGRQEA